MNLQLADQLFMITGATSGFGYAVTKKLLQEGASVIINARNGKSLNDIKQRNPSQVQYVRGDLTETETIERLEESIAGRKIKGVFVNSGGPPALSFHESTSQDWDQSYNAVLKWKIELTRKMVPVFKKNGYGRFLFLESATIKQPIPSLILSNTFRAAVAGFVKSLSQEIASENITCNILAPGYHDTPALERIIQKQSKTLSIPFEKAREKMEEQIPVKKLGDPEDLASLALWLLSPLSGFVTGQIFTLDGGTVRSTI